MYGQTFRFVSLTLRVVLFFISSSFPLFLTYVFKFSHEKKVIKNKLVYINCILDGKGSNKILTIPLSKNKHSLKPKN
jgi:hypothetical protein